MMHPQTLRLGMGRLVLAGLALALVYASGPAQGSSSKLRKPSARAGLKKSDNVVKVTAKADKPDADGKQTVTVTLTIDKGWHTYANPAQAKGFDPIETKVTVTGKNKPNKVTLDYPKGKFVGGIINSYVYEDVTVIKAVVQRAKGDTGPLQLSVKIQACNDKTCLLPATVKLTVE